jgi:hypothetical protein
MLTWPMWFICGAIGSWLIWFCIHKGRDKTVVMFEVPIMLALTAAGMLSLFIGVVMFTSTYIDKD